MGSQYVVRFEVDPGGEGWTVTVPAIQGCRSYGSTLQQGRRRIREALILFVDDADDAEFIDEIVVPAATRKKIEVQRHHRIRAEEEAARAGALLRESVAELLRLGLTRRDAAHVLGLSFQRIHQLAEQPRQTGFRRSETVAATSHRRATAPKKPKKS